MEARQSVILEDPYQKSIKLPRGGLLVDSSIGYIQFGAPHHSMADVQMMGLKVPEYYVMPTVIFDKKYLIHVIELENPIVHNFVKHKKKTKIVCTQAMRENLIIIFEESVFGPASYEFQSEEFHNTFDQQGYPDFKKEIKFFLESKNLYREINGVKEVVSNYEHLIDFLIYDSDGIVKLPNDIEIKFQNSVYTISDAGQLIASIADSINIYLADEMKDARYSFLNDDQTINLNLLNPYISSMSNVNAADKSGKLNREAQLVSTRSFSPPLFGVTPLGSIRNNDDKDIVIGFIIWINGRGIVVDPPPFSQKIMDKLGIPKMYIEMFILTHCHFSHDIGIFQHVIDSSRVEIVTTRTIMNSFTRKYSALTGMTQEIIVRLFKFRPVIIGAPLNINGAGFRFFYTFYRVPTIGFEIVNQDKSVYFSSDTLYNPKILLEAHQRGIIKKKRFELLTNTKFHNFTFIIHDGSISSDRTPISVLAGFPQKIKEKMWVFHEDPKKVDPSLGLNIVKPTTDILIFKVKPPKAYEYLRKIEILCSVEVFENVSLRNAKDLLHSVKEEHYTPGQLVIKEGSIGNKFYIIIKGVGRVFSDKPGNQFQRFYYVGDYFGESALVFTTSKRLANVEAVTELDLLVMERHDFWFVFGDGKGGGGPIISKLLNLLQARKTNALSAITKNAALSELSAAQKTQLEMICTETKIKQNQILWSVGEEAKFGFIVGKGTFKFVECSEASLSEFEVGAFIGEIPAFINNTPLTTSVQAVADSVIFLIDKEDLLGWFNKNPSLYVLFSKSKYFE